MQTKPFLYINILFFLLLISCNNNIKERTHKNQALSDSVSIWIKQSKKKDLELTQKKESLIKAYQLVNNQNNDSIKNVYLTKIAFQAYKIKDVSFFKEVNTQARKQAIQLNDTAIIADTYWNSGLMYGVVEEKMDSSYYDYRQAHKLFDNIGFEYHDAKMLYNMGFILSRLKDYTGSEINISQALSKFKKLKKNQEIYNCYNHLGLVYFNLKEFNNAIYSNNNALKYLGKVDNKKTQQEGTYNNLGLIYQEKQEYDKAIKLFNKALSKHSLKKENLSFYARLIDNLNYAKFLRGDKGASILDSFNEALQIRDSMNNKAGIVMSKLHLAEYHGYQGDTSKAILLAQSANQLAHEVNNYGDVLNALKLLSKLDKQLIHQYQNEYIKISDSLHTVDRKIRNKFTRIRFETDEYIEETEALSEQKLFIIIGSSIIVILLLLIYYIRVQLAKNKELMLESEQQKTNEEIYNLILNQHSKLEEGRLKERQRISEDLHDGVLGKIFGTRLGLGFLNLKGDDETLDKHKILVHELQAIEKEIREISHELKNEILSSHKEFIKIIETLLDKQHVISNFQFEIHGDEHIYWDQITQNIKINLYRIVQESIQNINKYAEATFVTITFKVEGTKLILLIEDNGKGFDTHKKIKGIGLKNIKSRIQKLKGKLSIESIINSGTKITVEIPLK